MPEHILYHQSGLPIFQNKVYATSEQARNAPTGDVELVQSESSGLVRNRLFDSSRIIYDGDYENEQAHSSAFRDHLAKVLEINLQYCRPPEVGVEIGCGKGHFLELLLEHGADFTGFDPSYTGDSPRVRKQYFGNEELATRPDHVVLRHVLEHIDRPWHFIEALRQHCKDNTRIYMEVPSFDWIVANSAIYDIFYEHVNYFSLSTLLPAFGSILSSGALFGGQYIYVVANLDSFRTPDRFHGPRYEALDLDNCLTAIMHTIARSSSRKYIWGAGAKGITIANLLKRRGIEIDALIDINPQKQGRYAGGSGLPILSPTEAIPRIAGMDVLVMNPIYMAEIQAQVGNDNVNWIAAA